MSLSRRTMLTGAAVAGAALGATPSAARAAPLLGPAEGVALLSRNENPYGPAPSAIAAMQEHLRLGAYYAEGAGRRLVEMIAKKNRVTPDHVVLGAGSGEVLNAAAMAFGSTGTLLGATLFWDAFFRYAQEKGVRVKRVPLKPDFFHDFAAMEAACTPDVTLLNICNPNNPTGLLEPRAALHAFAERMSARTFVLVDEAYNELAADPDENSVIDLVRAGRNVGVSRTFSKIYGMAGLRIGYIIAPPDKARLIRDWVMASPNGVSMAAAVACYNDEGFLRFSRGKVVEGREMVQDAARRLGLRHLPSATNFVWVDVGQPADAVRDRFAARGVLIRGAYAGGWTTWSRVSMGRLEDVERYCRALPEVLSA